MSELSWCNISNIGLQIWKFHQFRLFRLGISHRSSYARIKANKIKLPRRKSKIPEIPTNSGTEISTHQSEMVKFR